MLGRTAGPGEKRKIKKERESKEGEEMEKHGHLEKGVKEGVQLVPSKEMWATWKPTWDIVESHAQGACAL